LDFIVNSFLSAVIGALILTLFQIIANKLMLKYKIKEMESTENGWIYELGKRINWFEEQRNNLRCQIEKRKATIREQESLIQKLKNKKLRMEHQLSKLE
jgi:hypothetical protein